MREAAADPSVILQDVFVPDASASADSASRFAESEPTALRELMDWVSNEVFGPA
jgi:hypothetical protein